MTSNHGHSFQEPEPQNFISGSKVKARFGICSTTLRGWANSGKVDVVRFGVKKKRLYRYSDILAMFDGYRPHNPDGKAVAAAARARSRIIDARVSSASQRDDLRRQVQLLKEAYPEHEVVTDIASGINWKRPGLLRVLDRALKGDVSEIVVAHRDRLCRV